MSKDDTEIANHADGDATEIEPSPLVNALRKLRPDTPVRVPSPDIDGLLAGHSRKKWLETDAKALAGGGDLQRLAAVGLLLRLWVPADRDERTALINELLEQRFRSEVEERCNAFLESLTEEDAGRLEGLAVEMTILLDGQLEEIRESVVAADTDAGMLGLALLLDRDDLESIHQALARRTPSQRLKETLDVFDRRATINASMLREADIPVTDRLLAVAGTEPDSWWSMPVSGASLGQDQGRSDLEVDGTTGNSSSVISLPEGWKREPVLAAAAGPVSGASTATGETVIHVVSVSVQAWSALIRYDTQREKAVVSVKNAPDARKIVFGDTECPLESRSENTGLRAEIEISRKTLGDVTSFSLIMADGSTDHGRTG